MQDETDTRARAALLKDPFHAGTASPPQYDRVVRSLSNDELQQEATSGKGERGYQQAVAAELERRVRP